MWEVNGLDLTMAEGDYGIQLPVIISGTELSEGDVLKFTFKARKNGNTILEKDFSGILNNTVNLELTQQESAMFSVGVYVYSLDWYQNGLFMCNIILCSAFRVVDKA